MSKKNEPTIEQKITQLEEIVAWFNGDDFELELALERYESAQKLAETIQQELTSLKHTIVRIDSDAV